MYSPDSDDESANATEEQYHDFSDTLTFWKEVENARFPGLIMAYCMRTQSPEPRERKHELRELGRKYNFLDMLAFWRTMADGPLRRLLVALCETADDDIDNVDNVGAGGDPCAGIMPLQYQDPPEQDKEIEIAKEKEEKPRSYLWRVLFSIFFVILLTTIFTFVYWDVNPWLSSEAAIEDTNECACLVHTIYIMNWFF